MASIQTALSALEECAQEYCTIIREVKSQPELFDCIFTLCGFPASAAETAELIEILQTEQALLHSTLSRHPGNPSKYDLALTTKLKTTTDLLSLMHESTHKAGFPSKGFGFRKAFAVVARNSIDTLVDKIAVSRISRPPGLPDLETSAVGEPDILAARPTGLPPRLVPRSLASIRAPAPTAERVALSTCAEQPSPYIEHFIGTPSTDKAILATKVGSSSTSQSSEPKPRNLAASLEALKHQAKGMLGMLAASSSSFSSSTSNTKSKTKTNETSGRSEVLSQAKSYLSLASDELQAKLAKARLRAEGTKAKLAQIEADAELAMLLQIQGTLSSSVGPSNPHLGDPQTANSKNLRTC